MTVLYSSTFSFAAFVVWLQVETRVAVTDVGPAGVQTDVFANHVRRRLALININTGQTRRTVFETCSAVTSLQR